MFVKFISRRATVSGPRYLIEGLEPRAYFVGDILGVSFSPGIGNTVASPYQTTLTTMITPTKQDPNYTGAVPQGNISVGWWGGPVLASVLATTTPTQVPLTLDASNAGTRIPSGTYAGQHVLYVEYSGDGTYVANTYTETDFEEYESRGVPGYGVQFSGASSGMIAVTAQPTNSAAGAKFDTPVKVATLDSSGSVMTSSTASITVALATTSTGTGTLSGTTTVAEVNGVATFSDLSVSTPGQYSLTFHDTTGDSTASGLFEISGGKLVFKPGPTNGTAGDPLAPFTVVLEDAKNKVITSDSSSVVTLTPIGLKANPVISGNSAQLVNGRAVFSNLVLKNPDLYKLSADDGGDTAVVSGRFKVAGDTLKFLMQPATGDVDAPVPLAVEVLNARGQRDTLVNSVVSLTLNTVAGGANAELAGTTTLAFTGGVATFAGVNDPTIDAPGTFTLTATEEDTSTGVLGQTLSVTPVKSRSFKILGLHLAFTRPPVNTNVGTEVPFEIQLEDTRNHPVTTGQFANRLVSFTTTPSDLLTLSSLPNPSQLTNGKLESVASNGLVFHEKGTYTITAATYTIPADQSVHQNDPEVMPVTSRPVKALGFHLNFSLVLYSDVGDVVPFVLHLLDSRDRDVTTGAFANRLISLHVNPSTLLTVNQVPDPSQLVDGELQSFAPNGLAIHDAGTYTITATAYTDPGNLGAPETDPAIMPVTSRPIRVRPLHLDFKEQVPDTNVGIDIPFTLELKNADGDPVTTGTYASRLISFLVEPSGMLTLNDQPQPSQLANGELSSAAGNGLAIHDVGRFKITATAYTGADSPETDTNVLPITSRFFKILPFHLAFAQRPLNTTAGTAIPFIVHLEDADDKPVASGVHANDLLALSISPAGSYSYPTPFPMVNGTAASTESDGLIITTPGVYVLTITPYTDPDAPATDTSVTPLTTTIRVLPASRVSR